MRIAHASIDEHNQIKGGESGNQTGREVCIRKWYNKPWSILIRHPSRETREKIAHVAETLASPPFNQLIGYDQSNRNSFHDIARKYGYNLKDYIGAHETSETDCSAFVTCVCLFAGIKELEYTGNAPSTSTMKTTFEQAGFEIYTDSKHVGSDAYLSKGDILVKPGSHTVIVLDDGSMYNKKTVSVYPQYTGDSDSIVEALKEMHINSSKANRAKIYAANFEDRYTFSASQNMKILSKLKSGTLIKP